MSIDKDLLDRLMEGRQPGDLFGKDGILQELTKALAERVLSTELDEHLTEARSDPPPEGANQPPNRRNGTSPKTVTTDSGKVVLDLPRDRNGSFDPVLIAKYQRRFPEFDTKIISMDARGMTTREIQGHIEEIYGIEASPSLISAITDAVMDEVGVGYEMARARLAKLVAPIISGAWKTLLRWSTRRCQDPADAAPTKSGRTLIQTETPPTFVARLSTHRTTIARTVRQGLPVGKGFLSAPFF